MQPVAKMGIAVKVNVTTGGKLHPMLPIGLNHMTVPNVATQHLLQLASALGCAGVELRNDLGRPLFDDDDPATIAALAAAQGQRVLALAEVKAFNVDPEEKLHAVQDLIDVAVACGAEAVALIPAVAARPTDRVDQRMALRQALEILQPLLENAGLMGLIEPLGFIASTLRFKQDVVRVLDDMGRPACFGIVHDTFHHHLSGETMIAADLTAIVHISGISDPEPAVHQMADLHRVLVDANDRLHTVDQLRRLQAAGYKGPASFEVFAPEIHDMTDPAAALAGSIAFIHDALADVSAGAA